MTGGDGTEAVNCCGGGAGFEHYALGAGQDVCVSRG